MATEEDKNVFLESLRKEANPPAGPEGSAPRKGMSKTALFATLFVLFLLIITLLIFVISVGGAENPILQSFGIQSGEVKEFLLGLVNWTFGTLVIILLLLFAIGLFRGIAAPKEAKERRRNSIVFGLVSGGLIFAVVLLWLLGFTYINNLPASALGSRNRIEVLNIEPGERIVGPLTISFSAAGIEEELQNRGKKILGFRWDADEDGTFEVDTGQNPAVNLWFTEEGKHIVRLQVEIENEAPQVFETAFIINEIAFAADPDSGEAPLTVEFDASDVTRSLAVKSYEWDLDGNGSYEESSTGAKINYVFNEIGTYTVRLRVILQDGQVRQFQREITVGGATNERLSAVITADPETGTAPLTVRFSARNSFTSEGSLTGYFWKFDDDESELRGETVTHTYTTPGTYQLELEVRNSIGLIDTTTLEIAVQTKASAPVIRVKTVPALNERKEIIVPEGPAKITFSATDTTDPEEDIIAFSWDFTNDAVEDFSGEEAEYTFTNAGNFPVKLSVHDAAGNVSNFEFTVVVQGEATQAMIDATPETGAVPLTIEFDGSRSGCGVSCRIISYEWDFDDGTAPQITGAHTTHTFTKVGTFSVTLKVTTDSGKTATNQKVVAVRVPPLKACFTSSRSQGKAPLTVSFSDCSSGTIEQWKWDFGDGAISEERAPEHTFQNPGKYTVFLAVTDSANTTSKSSQLITVE